MKHKDPFAIRQQTWIEIVNHFSDSFQFAEPTLISN